MTATENLYEVHDTPRKSFIKADEFDAPPKKCCTKLVVGITLLVVGIVFVVVGIVFGTYMPGMMDDKLTTGALTCNAGDVTETFRDGYGDCEKCVPFYYEYHPFNVTNAQKILNAVSSSDTPPKPKIQERGPYTFRKRTIKQNEKFDGNTVTYQSYNTWSFDAAQSCAGCDPDKDEVIKPDLSYLRIITCAGGETNFLDQLFTGLLRAKTPNITDEQIAATLSTARLIYKSVMHVLSGLNSMHTESMLFAVQALQPLLVSDDMATAGMELLVNSELNEKIRTDIRFSGVFTKKTVMEYAYGSPSFLAGLALGGNYGKCLLPASPNSDKTLNQYCQECGYPCVDRYYECNLCRTAGKVIQLTNGIDGQPGLCDDVRSKVYKDILAKTNDEATAATTADNFVGGTCRQCNLEGKFMFCLTPFPGAMESSGYDWNGRDIIPSILAPSTQNTGCGNKYDVSNYEVYDGLTAIPMWSPSQPAGVNPDANALAAFNLINYCPNNDKIYCQPVYGGDGASFPSSGADLNGLKTEVAFTETNLYVSQARQNVTVYPTGEKPSVRGITLTRFRPLRTLLTASSWNEYKGTGHPVNGVQSLAYNTGFLAYVSYPFFMFGDTSLITDIDLYRADGTKMTEEVMYSNGEVKAEINDAYSTYVDVEPATGKTMNARKRLMASYAIARVVNSTDSTDVKPITDQTYKGMPTDIIMPVYWGEERATVTSKLASTFSSADSLGDSMLPVLIVGVVAGVLLIIAGGFLIYKFKQSQRHHQF